MDNTVGLKAKYRILKANGRPTDPDGLYFVLKANSKDKDHARASRRALIAYAEEIKPVNELLHNDLMNMVTQLGGV